MINALRDIQMKYEGIWRRQQLLLCSVGTCIGSQNISRIWASGSQRKGYWPLALKGKDTAAEKMAVERLQPAKQ